MGKVGICTLFNNNRNYGAILQSYALCRIVNSFGHEPEMIVYFNQTFAKRCAFDITKKLLRIFNTNKDALSDKLALRNNLVDSFKDSIPHSVKYYANTVKSANNNYDCFIVGSDQVWNPNWINRFLSLDFAYSDKLTISYAASVGRIKLDSEQQKILKNALNNTKHISIREKETIPALQKLTDKKIEHVLDPTMLLTKEEWDEICSPRLIDEDYMFCYFLGNNDNLRNAASEFSRKKELKIVTLPYLNGEYRKVDDGFGDLCLYDISPNDFLSLIKYASFVMTDSFHATVFSHIYEREFAVSGGGKNERVCRMLSLTEMFGTENRYIKEHSDVTADALSDIYNRALEIKWDEFRRLKKNSLLFLMKSLNDE